MEDRRKVRSGLCLLAVSMLICGCPKQGQRADDLGSPKKIPLNFSAACELLTAGIVELQERSMAENLDAKALQESHKMLHERLIDMQDLAKTPEQKNASDALAPFIKQVLSLVEQSIVFVQKGESAKARAALREVGWILQEYQAQAALTGV